MSSLVNSVIHNWRNYKKNAVILDTEITSLDELGEVIEVCVIDVKGNVLFESLVRPVNGVSREAYKVHGISEDDLLHAPHFDQIYSQLEHVLTNRNVIAYNCKFDRRLLDQTARIYDLRGASQFQCNWLCAMESYADFKKTPHPERRGYRWHSLKNAASQLGIELPTTLHRARADAQLTLDVIEAAYAALTNQTAGEPV